jgi:D-alanine-D-alanine ligase
LKIAVLKGGRSSEREISLKTGKAVAEGLRRLGHEVIELDTEENFPQNLIEAQPDLVFIALHGPYGEDGRVQGLLDMLEIPYVGTGVLGSAIAMDKEFTKKILRFEGIPTPDWVCVRKDKNFYWDRFPAVVKPADQGSSVGLKIVKKRKELEKAVKELFDITDKVIIEPYIVGRDMTVGILKDRPLPVIEIRPRSGVYDFKSKYTKGETEYLFLEDEILGKKLKDIALKVHRALELKDFSRVDFRVDHEDNPYVLEVNTIPGMTELSLFPMACAKEGIDFTEMLSIIIS